MELEKLSARLRPRKPNESMDLGVFEKAIAANVYLLDELAALGDIRSPG